jgi:hypothetical protein
MNPRIKEIVDALVPMIKEGELLDNVADKAMLMARGIEDIRGEIPQSVSKECRVDDDAWILYYSTLDEDNYVIGVRLTNLAFDQIRASE